MVEEMQTDVHIVGGRGNVGYQLYIDLLNSMQNSSGIGNVYSYVSGNITEEQDFSDFLMAANKEGNEISVELASRLRKEERTSVTQYDSLDTLTETLHSRALSAKNEGKRSIVVFSMNYNLDFLGLNYECTEFEQLSGDAKQSIKDNWDRVQATFSGIAEGNLAERWKELKKDRDSLAELAVEYVNGTIDSYMGFINEHFAGAEYAEWRGQIEQSIIRIIKGKKTGRSSGIESACIGVKNLALAMSEEKEGESTDSLFDQVLIVTNPIDISTYVYSAVTGRDPSTVFCPQDNDRRRYARMFDSRFLVSAQNDCVNVIGPHNHWNLLVPGHLSGYLGDLSDIETLMRLEDLAVSVNLLAEDQLGNTRRTPTDYFPVIHEAVLRVIDSNLGSSHNEKLILWSPDEQMYVGWMGEVTPQGVVAVPYHNVFRSDALALTLDKWNRANASVEGMIGGLVDSGFVERIIDRTLQERLDVVSRRTKQEHTTRVSLDAYDAELESGSYLVTTHYDQGMLYLAFVERTEGLFNIKKLIELPNNNTPRSIVYDDGEVYYSHSQGIDAVNLHSGRHRNVLRINELNGKRIVGVNSLVVEGDNILFTVSGYGVGVVKKNAKRTVAWKDVAVYSTQEHVDSLTLFDGKYAALSGQSILLRDGTEWSSVYEGNVGLEALAENNNGLVAVGRGNREIGIVEWSLQGVQERRIPCIYARPARLQIPRKYRSRTKAAIHNDAVLIAAHGSRRTSTVLGIGGDYREFGVGVSNIDAIHPDDNGLIIAGNRTVYLRMPEVVVEPVHEFGTRNNDNYARFIATINV